MRMGSLELVLAPRVRAHDRVTSPEGMGWVYRYLAELGRVLHGERWMVVSGLAIPLHAGAFYRGHGDIDIGVPLSTLSSVEARMRDAGFAFTRRLAMLHVNRTTRLELHRHTHSEAPAVKRRPRHLRFWRRNGRSLERRPYIDVFPYVEEEGEIVVLQDDARIPVDGPLWEPVTLPCGTEVPVETLSHVAHAKAAGIRAKDELDRRMLETHAFPR